MVPQNGAIENEGCVPIKKKELNDNNWPEFELIYMIKIKHGVGDRPVHLFTLNTVVQI